MNGKHGYAILSALLALTLAALACSAVGGAPTSAPTIEPTLNRVPATTAPTRVPATKAPTEVPTTAATDTPEATATEAPTTAPTKAAPTKAPLSGKLELQGVATYLDSGNYYYVVGLVTNGTGKPVNHIQLSLQVTDSGGKSVLLDDSGNPTSTVSVPTILSTIDSGGSTPFEYHISASGVDTSKWQQKVEIAGSETPSDLKRVQVEVANPLMNVSSSGEIYLTGELVNKSDKLAQIDEFAGAMLDGSGNVAGASRFQDVTRILSPAGDAAGTDRTPFVIHIPGPVKKDATPSYYIDAVEGSVSDNQAAADIHLKLNTSFADADNGVHVLATVSNSGTNTMTVRVVAGLYDQSGQVLDASSTDAPLDLAPGESSPVPFSYFANLNGNADLIGKVMSYTAQIDPYWTFTVNTDFVPLQASNVTTEVSGSSVTVKGDVVNTSKKPLDRATVVITVHDADGKLVAADYTYAASPAVPHVPIAPKAKESWSVTLSLPTKLDPSTLKYDTIVQGIVEQ